MSRDQRGSDDTGVSLDEIFQAISRYHFLLIYLVTVTALMVVLTIWSP